MVTSNFIRIFEETLCKIQIIETYIPASEGHFSGQWRIVASWILADNLFQANTMDRDANWASALWAVCDFRSLSVLSEAALTPDPNFFAIIKRADNKRGGAGKLSA